MLDPVQTLSEDLPEKPNNQRFEVVKRIPVTLSLAVANMVVWIIMVVSGVGSFDPLVTDLINWGGNLREATLDEQSWRLFSSLFLHAGILHLAMNMFSLVLAGLILEPALGGFRYALTYFLSGLFSSVFSIYFKDQVVSVGASGAIFGLFGAILMLLLLQIKEKAVRLQQLKSMGLFIALQLLYSLDPKIDFAAHAFGLVGGMIIGVIFSLFSVNRVPFFSIKNLMATVLSISLLMGSAYYFYGKINRAPIYWNKTIYSVMEKEEEAIELYNAYTDSLPVLAQVIEKEILPVLTKCLLTIDSFPENSLSGNLLQERILLESYYSKRLSLFRYQMLSIQEDTDKYENNMRALSREIEELGSKFRFLRQPDPQ